MRLSDTALAGTDVPRPSDINSVIYAYGRWLPWREPKVTQCHLECRRTDILESETWKGLRLPFLSCYFPVEICDSIFSAAAYQRRGKWVHFTLPSPNSFSFSCEHQQLLEMIVRAESTRSYNYRGSYGAWINRTH